MIGGRIDRKKGISGKIIFFLNAVIWLPYTAVIFVLAIYSRIRNRPCFSKDADARLTFFKALPDHSLSSPEWILHKSLEGQLLLNNKDALRSPVLDIGTGEGAFAAWIGRFQGKIDAGIDADVGQVEAARIMGAYRNVQIGPAESIPFPDSTFGTVMSICVLEHVEGIREAFGEMGRVLKKGGDLVLTVISKDHDKGLLIPNILKYVGLNSIAGRYTEWFNDKNRHHRPGFDIADYKELAGEGYDIVCVKRFFSRRNRMLYDLLGLPSIIFPGRFSNNAAAFVLLCRLGLRGPVRRIIKWLLVPRLINDEKESGDGATHVFLIIKKTKGVLNEL